MNLPSPRPPPPRSKSPWATLLRSEHYAAAEADGGRSPRAGGEPLVPLASVGKRGSVEDGFRRHG
ncbi:hypothetical protein MCBG_04216 [Micromonospora sp. M42]|nr:hypothetical protein MCBG_04216 [Micromonospora sp. M42]